jgi:hypothetical protein
VKLYKYRRWDDRTKTALEKCEFWASRPSELNDPFDCQVRFDEHVSRDDFRQKIAAEADRYFPQRATAEREHLVNAYVESNWPPSRNKVDRFQAEYAERVSKIGVISFSARWDSVVMWSHYADQHRGVCIEVDSTTFSGSVGCHPVRYQAERPLINLFRDGMGAHKHAALVKNDEWRYEEEWRFTLEGSVKSGPIPQAVQFPEGAITAVIIVARARPEHQVEVEALAARLLPAPKLYGAFLHSERFTMDRRELSPSDGPTANQ